MWSYDMNKAIVIGMTGPTGSGKSTVGELLREKGFEIIDADKVARQVTEKGSPTLLELCSVFGDDILLEDGALDRAALAKKAFADKESLDKLNSITHPAIISLINQEIAQLKASGEIKIILDAPQLFEAGADKLCDFVLSVLADKSTRLDRIMSRDGITEEQALSRINAQKSDDFFAENSDFIIYNDTDVDALAPQVEFLIQKLERDDKKNAKSPERKKKFIILGVVAALVIAIVVGLIIWLMPSYYTRVMDKSLQLYRYPSSQQIEDIYPEQVWEYLLNEKYAVVNPDIKTVDDIIEHYFLAETQEISNKVEADFGADWDVELEVISEYELENEELDRIAADLKGMMSEEVEIEQGYRVNVHYKLYGSKSSSENYMVFTAVEIDSEWYAVRNFPNVGWRITVLEF